VIRGPTLPSSSLPPLFLPSRVLIDGIDAAVSRIAIEHARTHVRSASRRSKQRGTAIVHDLCDAMDPMNGRSRGDAHAKKKKKREKEKETQPRSCFPRITRFRSSLRRNVPARRRASSIHVLYLKRKADQYTRCHCLYTKAYYH